MTDEPLSRHQQSHDESGTPDSSASPEADDLWATYQQEVAPQHHDRDNGGAEPTVVPTQHETDLWQSYADDYLPSQGRVVDGDMWQSYTEDHAVANEPQVGVTEVTDASEDEDIPVIEVPAEPVIAEAPDETDVVPASSEPIAETAEMAEQDFDHDQTYEPAPPRRAREPLSFSEWLQALFTGVTPGQLDNLTARINARPDAPSNYVVRGEFYLQQRGYAAAYRDFQRALNLAATQFEASNWGLIEQTLQDRAQVGLDAARAHLERRSQPVPTDDDGEIVEIDEPAELGES